MPDEQETSWSNDRATGRIHKPPPPPPPTRTIREPLLWQGVALGGLVSMIGTLIVVILIKLWGAM